MIGSFRCKKTGQFAEGAFVCAGSWLLNGWRGASWPNWTRPQPWISCASRPGNRLEALRGDHAGQYSIRINDRWRLCFRFVDGDVQDAEIVDYH